MLKILKCRRSVVALTGILSCTILGLHNGVDTSVAISMICAALAGANAAQGTLENRRVTDAGN